MTSRGLFNKLINCPILFISFLKLISLNEDEEGQTAHAYQRCFFFLLLRTVPWPPFWTLTLCFFLRLTHWSSSSCSLLSLFTSWELSLNSSLRWSLSSSVASSKSATRALVWKPWMRLFPFTASAGDAHVSGAEASQVPVSQMATGRKAATKTFARE